MKILIQPCRVGYLVTQAGGTEPARPLVLPNEDLAYGFARGWAEAARRRLNQPVSVEVLLPEPEPEPED